MILDPAHERIEPIPHSGCWIWTGGLRGKNKYGCVRWLGRQEGAHRVSWMQHRGAIPDGMLVLHKCDVPACVNPDHLFLGTQQDNVDDMMRKGRKNAAAIAATQLAMRAMGIGRGENSPRAKLAESDVFAIRASRKTAASLAEEYGISRHTVNDLRRGRNWRHLAREA